MPDNLQYFAPLLINITKYFLFAGIPFLIFYVLFPPFFSKQKIQARLASKKDFIREILHSMQTTFILAAVGLLVMKTPLRAYTPIYDNPLDYAWWWIPLSVVLALVVHDTYFYWMHRMVHHPKLFRRVHLIHHQSINPSPWTSFSFHFFEGVLEAMVAPIILLLIPMHPIAILLFGLLSFAINVYGHLGYEIAPRWFRYSPLFEMINTSIHHNIHHSKFVGNYGLYFRFWDRVMGTENPDYVKEYDKIQAKRFGDYRPEGFYWKTLLSCFFILTLGALLISAKSGYSIEGHWKDSKDGGIMLIYEKDGLYFGQLISADSPEANQKIQAYGQAIILMKNFTKKSEKEYCCGTIFQPKEKRIVSATLILQDEDTLKINGRYGIFTGSRIWKRLP